MSEGFVESPAAGWLIGCGKTGKLCVFGVEGWVCGYSLKAIIEWRPEAWPAETKLLWKGGWLPCSFSLWIFDVGIWKSEPLKLWCPACPFLRITCRVTVVVVVVSAGFRGALSKTP